jgi:CheY-like chemotaxis protein
VAGSGQPFKGRKAGGGAWGPKRVLVVDDEASVRRLLGDLFTGEGYLVGEASDGAQALDCARVFRPDVIILDLMMPVMNGWTFAQEYRRIDGHGDVPIIAVSAMFQLHEAAPTLHALGVRACIAKPFDVEALLTLVSTLAA